MDDVKSSWPLRVGLHTCYNGGDNGLIPKSHLSSDWGLQLDPMKSESLVIADQHGSGEYVPGPCTHRPSHHGNWVYPKVVRQPAMEAANHGRLSDWGEVVTR